MFYHISLLLQKRFSVVDEFVMYVNNYSCLNQFVYHFLDFIRLCRSCNSLTNFWNMYEVAMINIAKTEEYYMFNTVLRKIPDIWSFVVGQNVDK